MKDFPRVALANVCITVWALRWYFRRQPRLDRRAKALRWITVTAGILLLLYGNLATNINRFAAAGIALFGGLVALNFAFFPRLSVWCAGKVSSDS
jgi:hypothetical protein